MDAFSKELTSLIPYVRACANNRLLDKNGVDDLVQDAMETAYRYRHHFRAEYPMKTWLATIVLNCFRNYLRKQRRLAIWVEYDDRYSAQISGGQYEHMELMEVVEAMSRLPEHQRKILIEAALGGKMYIEMAKEWHVPVATIKSRISRARGAISDTARSVH